MHFTIFKTPVISTLVRWMSIIVLRLWGWRVDSSAQVPAKCVLIGGPTYEQLGFSIGLDDLFCVENRCVLDG